MKKRLIKKMVVFIVMMLLVVGGSVLVASAAGDASDGWLSGRLVVTRGSGVWPSSQIRGTTSTSHDRNNDLRLEMWLVFDTSEGEKTTWSNVHVASNAAKLEKTLAAGSIWGRRGNAHHYGTCYHCGSYKYVETNVAM